VAVTRCGTVEAGHGLRVVDGRGAPLQARFGGFDHFTTVAS
jgi:hypothetical protein